MYMYDLYVGTLCMYIMNVHVSFVDYSIIDSNDILDIHKYIIKIS